MKKTLIILSHPNFKDSKLNKALVNAVKDLPDAEVRNLYDIYSGDITKIDVLAEQEKLIANERVVFEFPLYWYSSNAMLKEWMDKVLAYGFAYGHAGDKLKGKELLIATTTGGSEQDYANSPTGLGGLLTPFAASAAFVGMSFGGTFAVYNALNITDEELNKKALEYVYFIKG